MAAFSSFSTLALLELGSKTLFPCHGAAYATLPSDLVFEVEFLTDAELWCATECFSVSVFLCLVVGLFLC